MKLISPQMSSGGVLNYYSINRRSYYHDRSRSDLYLNSSTIFSGHSEIIAKKSQQFSGTEFGITVLIQRLA